MKKTVKKMALGGMGGRKPAGVPAFAKPAISKMMGAARPKPGMPLKPGMPPKPGGMGSRPPSQVMQFMSDTVRNASAGKPGRGGRPSVMGPKPPGGMGPRSPGGKPAGIGQGNFPRGALGAAGAMAGRALGKKAGGLAAGHKAADGVASKGKTKAKMVKMAGSTGMKRGGKVC